MDEKKRPPKIPSSTWKKVKVLAVQEDINVDEALQAIIDSAIDNEHSLRTDFKARIEEKLHGGSLLD